VITDKIADRTSGAGGLAPEAVALSVRDLVFTYPGAAEPVIDHLTFDVPRGARCLLLGANGVGKSTLLRVLSGRHMIDDNVVRVLGLPAFSDTSLGARVAFMGGPFPFAQDISVAEILAHRPGVDPARRGRVLEILDVNPGWRMHRVSDGQRRRVQLLLDLERMLDVVLLDEVTAELDVLARADLLRFLKAESETRGVTIMYASHVLDGLAAWATHLMFLGWRRVRAFGPVAAIPELAAPATAGTSALAMLCERWMAEDRQSRRASPTTAW
jgi:CCR4-NOT complex subunit CAF16